MKNDVCAFECRTTSVAESMYSSIKSEYESARSNFSLHKSANIMLDKSNRKHENTYRLMLLPLLCLALLKQKLVYSYTNLRKYTIIYIRKLRKLRLRRIYDLNEHYAPTITSKAKKIKTD